MFHLILLRCDSKGQVRRGFCMPCWLGPPCKVKSNRFAVIICLTMIALDMPI